MGILDETGSDMTNEELRSIRKYALEAEHEMEAQKARIEADVARMTAQAEHARATMIHQIVGKDYAIDASWPTRSWGNALETAPEPFVPPIPGLRTEIKDGQFRCASCSKLHLAGERMAWIPDHLRKGDGYEAFAQAIEKCNRSGNSTSSGWCMSCLPRPPRTRQPRFRAWEHRWSFEWIILHTILLPFLLAYRMTRMLLTHIRPALPAEPKPNAIATAPTHRENDDAAWCRRALEADPNLSDGAGVPLLPLIDRDLPDLAAHRDAIIAADPARTSEANASYAQGVALIRAAIEEGLAQRGNGLDTAMDEKLRFLSARHPGAADTVRTRRREQDELRAKSEEDRKNDSANDPRNFFEPMRGFDDDHEGWD